MLSEMTRDYLSVESWIQRKREQRESVKGKDTPFRVEFRYSGGTKHWQYFETFEATDTAQDRSIRHGFTGHATLEQPRSQQVQVRGPEVDGAPWLNQNH